MPIKPVYTSSKMIDNTLCMCAGVCGVAASTADEQLLVLGRRGLSLRHQTMETTRPPTKPRNCTVTLCPCVCVAAAL